MRVRRASLTRGRICLPNRQDRTRRRTHDLLRVEPNSVRPGPPRLRAPMTNQVGSRPVIFEEMLEVDPGFTPVGISSPPRVHAVSHVQPVTCNPKRHDGYEFLAGRRRAVQRLSRLESNRSSFRSSRT